MEVSGVSNSTAIDEWKQLQVQKEKEQKNDSELTAAQAEVAGNSQVTAAKNTTDSLSNSEKVLNVTNMDTVEISNEGRMYQQNIQSAKAESTAKTEFSTSAESAQNYTNLTNLTEDQIEELVDKGTITQAEANTELARRSGAEQNEQSTSTEQTSSTEEAILSNVDSHVK